MTSRIRHLMCAAWAAVAASAAAAQDSYLGMCDASAAVALGQGHFVVADDESDVLRIYKRGTAMPVGNVDLIDYLRNRKPSGKNAEARHRGCGSD